MESLTRDRRNQIGIALIVLVVILTIGLIVHLSPGAKSPVGGECRLSPEEPAKADLSKLKNLVSKTNVALLNVAGHLEVYTKNKPLYMPLAIDRFYSLATLGGSTFLELRTSDCFVIQMWMNRTNTSTVMHVYSIKVRLEPKMSESDPIDCTVQGGTFRIETTRNGTHYTCRTSKIYGCKRNHQLLATLNLDDLEFELDGNPEKTKQGEFSTDKEMCSAAED